MHFECFLRAKTKLEVKQNLLSIIHLNHKPQTHHAVSLTKCNIPTTEKHKLFMHWRNIKSCVLHGVTLFRWDICKILLTDDSADVLTSLGCFIKIQTHCIPSRGSLFWWAAFARFCIICDVSKISKTGTKTDLITVPFK